MKYPHMSCWNTLGRKFCLIFQDVLNSIFILLLVTTPNLLWTMSESTHRSDSSHWTNLFWQLQHEFPSPRQNNSFLQIKYFPSFQWINAWRCSCLECQDIVEIVILAEWEIVVSWWGVMRVLGVNTMLHLSAMSNDIGDRMEQKISLPIKMINHTN